MGAGDGQDSVPWDRRGVAHGRGRLAMLEALRGEKDEPDKPAGRQVLQAVVRVAEVDVAWTEKTSSDRRIPLAR
jgi:hypothetical protein